MRNEAEPWLGRPISSPPSVRIPLHTPIKAKAILGRVVVLLWRLLGAPELCAVCARTRASLEDDVLHISSNDADPLLLESPPPRVSKC